MEKVEWRLETGIRSPQIAERRLETGNSRAEAGIWNK